MTVVSVSRKKICDAIAKEPTTRLEDGNWYDADSDSGLTDCSVCAVGAVMRNACLDRRQPAHAIADAAWAATASSRHVAAHSIETPESLVADRFYMNALSVFFEKGYNDLEIWGLQGRSRMLAVKALKAECIDFIKKNFPPKIEIDIDGALPAKDVKVVKTKETL